MTDAEGASDRRLALTEYWKDKREGIVHRARPIWERALDRERVLANDAGFFTGAALIVDFIKMTMVDEDDIARRMIETAEFYLEQATERDELSSYASTGQHELGRGQRLKLLTMARWLKHRVLDRDAFRQAIEMKRGWNERIFGLQEWRETGFSLGEWMEELILIEEFQAAQEIHRKYWSNSGARRSPDAPEDVLELVARSPGNRGDASLHERAEASLDGLYRRVTDWASPGFRENDVLHDEKFVLAFIRGRYFKGEEDPIVLIKRMKFGE
jgi:hypothetical protein